MSKEYFDLLDENGNKTGKIKLRLKFIEMEIGIKQFIYGL